MPVISRKEGPGSRPRARCGDCGTEAYIERWNQRASATPLAALSEKDREIARLVGENKILRTQVESFAAGLIRASQALEEM